MYKNAKKLELLETRRKAAENENRAVAATCPVDTPGNRATMLCGYELSDDELELVSGGAGALYRRLLSGALVTTMVFASVPTAAIAEELGVGDASTTQNTIEVISETNDAATVDSTTQTDAALTVEADDQAPAEAIAAAEAAAGIEVAGAEVSTTEEADIEEGQTLVAAEAEARLTADFDRALVSFAGAKSDKQKEEEKRARTLKGVEVTGKAMMALGKLALGITTMNPSFLFGGGGDAFGVILTICGIGHGGPSNQDLMNGINDIKDSLKDIKRDLEDLKKDIRDLSLKNDIQYASKLVDALLVLESDCAGAANFYTPSMLKKIGMEPLPEDASPEQVAAWNDQVGKALKSAKKNKVNGFEYYDYYHKRVREDLTTVYAMLREGSESNPMDAWARYWEGTCNFESQAYGPKMWLRAAVETEVLNGYGLIATYTNIASDPEVIEASTTRDMQDMLRIAEEYDCGVSPEEVADGAKVKCYSLGRVARRNDSGVPFRDERSFGAAVHPAKLDEFVARLHGKSLTDELASAGLRDEGRKHSTYALGFRVVDGSAGVDGMRFIGWDGKLWGVGRVTAVPNSTFATIVKTNANVGGRDFLGGVCATTLNAGPNCFETLALE